MPGTRIDASIAPPILGPETSHRLPLEVGRYGVETRIIGIIGFIANLIMKRRRGYMNLPRALGCNEKPRTTALALVLIATTVGLSAHGRQVSLHVESRRWKRFEDGEYGCQLDLQLSSGVDCPTLADACIPRWTRNQATGGTVTPKSVELRLRSDRDDTAVRM